MFNRKLLLLSLLTVMSWLGVMAQNVNVHGTVINSDSLPQSGVNMIVSVYFADSTAAGYTTTTDANGIYSVDIPTQGPNFLGFLEVSMVDCWGTTESQYFTILNGNETFVADFVYCEEVTMDSCTVFILEEWNPNGGIQLTAWTPPGLGAEYLWSTGETSQSIIPQSSGHYAVTATFPWGCQGIDSTYVNLDSTSSCFAYILSWMNPDSSTYTLEGIASGAAPYTYQWSTGENIPTIGNVGPGTYCLTITDATGCSNATCIIVEDFNFCEVYIYEDPATGTLNAQGYGEAPFYYYWNTGDSTQQIFPNGPGLYCVTMTSANGCSATSCYDYGWSQDSCAAYVSAFVTDSNTFALQAIVFTSAPYWSYLWSTGETSEIIYPSDPSQSYCVTITDADGCVSSACYESSNYCYAWVDLQYVDTSVAILSVYTDPIFSLPGSDPITYQWSNGETTPVLTVTESGDYCVTVTIGSGCVTEACAYVNFEDLSTNCSAWVNTYSDSSGQWFAEAYAWGFGTFSYQWSNGDTNSVTQINSPNDYNCVTVTSSLGCETVACVDSFFSPCQVYISINYFSNSSAELMAIALNDPNQGAQYQWSTGETTQTITVGQEGDYCVTVYSGGCVSTSCAYVYFWSQDSCGVWISSEPSQDPVGTAYTANAWGIPPFTYQWSNGDINQTTVVDFGIQDLCVTVTDSTGCVSTACNFFVDSCYVGIVYTWGPVHALYLESSAPLISTIWSTGDTLPYIEITEPGQYCVTATTNFGCVTTTCIVIDTLIPTEGLNVINGTVYSDSLSSNQLEGFVYAYSYEPNSGQDFQLIDSAQIGQGGYYSFNGLPDGIYIVKAVLNPGSPGADEYLPTYAYSSTTWEGAYPYSLPAWFPFPLDIFMVQAEGGNGGGGVIGGVVTDPNHLVAGQDADNRGGAGLAGVEVIISDAQGNPLGYTWTLEDGTFRFTGLAWGTYRISYDIAGLTSPVMWVTLTPEDPEVLAVTLIANTGTVAVEEPGTIEEIRLYPNPATQEINIPVPGGNTQMDIQLIDMQGKVVYAGSETIANNIITVAVGSFAPGLYHINLKGDNGLYYGRFIKQD